jgi:hypothetical protein
LGEQPEAMQLRYLGSLQDIAHRGTNTIVFPFPTDMAGQLLKQLGGGKTPAS